MNNLRTTRIGIGRDPQIATERELDMPPPDDIPPPSDENQDDEMNQLRDNGEAKDDGRPWLSVESFYTYPSFDITKNLAPLITPLVPEKTANIPNETVIEESPPPPFKQPRNMKG